MTYTLQCSWCNAMIKKGDPCASVSHGICPACYAAQMAELANKKKGLVKLMDLSKITVAEAHI